MIIEYKNSKDKFCKINPNYGKKGYGIMARNIYPRNARLIQPSKSQMIGSTLYGGMKSFMDLVTIETITTDENHNKQ